MITPALRFALPALLVALPTFLAAAAVADWPTWRAQNTVVREPNGPQRAGREVPPI